MPRGGYREGAGGRSTWKHGKTKTIRVPDALADKILQIARVLDEQGFYELEETSKPSLVETQSKTLDLSGISIHAHRHGPAIYVSDLLRAGYEIRPERLARSLQARAREDLKVKGDLESVLQEFYE